MTETVKRWNAAAGQWDTVRVEVTEPPRRRRTRKLTPRQGTPRDLAGLSARMPGESLRYTAYDPEWSAWADMRRNITPAAIRTHRAAVIAPGRDVRPAPARKS